MNRLHNRIEPFAALYWAVGIVLTHLMQQMTQPAGLASLNCGTGTVLYGRGQFGSIWVKTRRLPAISDLPVLFIYGAEVAYPIFPNKTCRFITPEVLWRLWLYVGFRNFAIKIAPMFLVF